MGAVRLGDAVKRDKRRAADQLCNMGINLCHRKNLLLNTKGLFQII